MDQSSTSILPNCKKSGSFVESHLKNPESWVQLTQAVDRSLYFWPKLGYLFDKKAQCLHRASSDLQNSCCLLLGFMWAFQMTLCMLTDFHFLQSCLFFFILQNKTKETTKSYDVLLTLSQIMWWKVYFHGNNSTVRASLFSFQCFRHHPPDILLGLYNESFCFVFPFIFFSPYKCSYLQQSSN